MSRRKKPIEKELKLDLGCGSHKAEGCVGVDVRELPGVDVVWDLKQYPWPWGDDSIDGIESAFYFCYLTGPERNEFMDECHRIMKKGAKLVIRVPYWTHMRAIADPLMAWPPVCEMSFMFYNKEWRKNNQCEHYPIKCDFNFGYGYSLDADLVPRNDEYRQNAIKHWNNTLLDLHITLTKS